MQKSRRWTNKLSPPEIRQRRQSMNCLKNCGQHKSKPLLCDGNQRNGRKKGADSLPCDFQIICALSLSHRYGMEISKNFWPWSIPLDSHKKRDRRELGYSRFTLWHFA